MLKVTFEADEKYPVKVNKEDLIKYIYSMLRQDEREQFRNILKGDVTVESILTKRRFPLRTLIVTVEKYESEGTSSSSDIEGSNTGEAG